MMRNQNRLPAYPDTLTAIPQVRVPMSLTLISSITVTVVLSLGLLTALMSWLVTKDIRSTAEKTTAALIKQTLLR
ncbi:MAG: hypothetical protein LBG24_10305 [Treponema sp.]|nr:hypothetical protein [Treponema sp.]